METNNKRIKFARITYFILAILFLLSVLTQFYFAGLAIFMDAGAWMKHISFVHLFGFNLPLFMLIFAMLGAMPRAMYLQSLSLLVFIFLMYFTTNIRAQVPWLGPLHVMVAIPLFALSCFIVFKAWRINFKQKQFEER